MPFKSEKQRRFLWKKHPEIARRWAKEEKAVTKSYPNSFFGVSDDDTFFNLAEANKVFKSLMDMPVDEGQMMVSAALLDTIPLDLEHNRGLLLKRATEIVTKQLSDVRPHLVRSLVSKRDDQSVEAISGVVECLDLISKAFPSGIDRQYIRGGDRENPGRFSHSRGPGSNIPTTRVRSGSNPPKFVKQRLKNLPQASTLDRTERQSLYDAYTALDQFIQDHGGNIPNNTPIQFRIGGAVRDITSRNPETALDPAWFRGGALPEHLSVDLPRSTGDSVDTADLLWDMLSTNRGWSDTGPQAERIEAIGSATNALASNDFSSRWNEARPSDNATPSDRVYRRVGAGAALAEMLVKPLPDNSKLKMAVQTAAWVGDHGSEAEKVFGPTARKTSYRYRGVERKPDEILQRSIRQAVVQEQGDTTTARAKIIYGERQAPRTIAEVDSGRTQEITESKVIDYFINRLPRPDIAQLHLNAGFTPPSEGVIINSKGQVVTQAVGYGDDHYLPFNLRNLSKLKGGEYIRTRASGGLTTEDVLAGLMSGARAVTVVSRNGIYTMEFDETFRGNRRYSDKAYRMFTRYGKILDAVESRQVIEDIPPDMVDEWESYAFKRKMSPEQTKVYVDKEKERWRSRPYMSDTEKQKVASAYLENVSSVVKTPTGEDFDTDQLRRQVEAQLAAKPARDLLLAQEKWDQQATGLAEYGDPAANLGPRPEATTLRAQMAEIASSVSTDSGLVEALDRTTFRRNDGKSHKDAFALATASAEKDYIRSHSPLRLNGEGYHKALRTLQEQFPYYVKKIDYRPLKDPELGRAGATDRGYVKPYFNRPAGAKAGYFDPTIIGSGKISADQTSYQNMGALAAGKKVREEERAQAAPVATATPTGVGGGQGKGPSASPSTGASWTDPKALDAAWKAYEDLTHNAASNGYMVSNPNGATYGIQESPPNELAKAYPFLWGNKLRTTPGPLGYDEFMSLMDTSGAVGWKALTDDLNKATVGQYKYLTSAGQPMSRQNNILLERFGTSGATIRVDWTPEAARRPNTEFNFPGYAYERGADPGAVKEELNEQFTHLPPGLISAMAYTPERAIEIASSPAMQTKIRDLSQAYTDTEEMGKKAEVAEVLETLSRIRQLSSQAKVVNEREKRLASIESWTEAPKPEAPKTEAPKIEASKPGEPPKIAAVPRKTIDPDKVQKIVSGLDTMVGMDSVSMEVDGLISSALNNVARERAGLPVDPKTMHLVFTGEPGTGKTTVAEIVAPLYKELGLTKNDKIVKTTPKDFVAPYLGQTRMKTAAKFEEAKGGVLFIDEAYGLADGHYGSEAIDELLTKMEQHRDDTVIIVAGYPKEMTSFLKVNPGLASRFSKTVHFPNYTTTELQKIFNGMMARGKYTTTEEGYKLVKEVVGGIAQDTNSANGRDVRNLYDAVRTAQSKRLRRTTNPSQRDLSVVTEKDIRDGVSAYYGRKL